ncbi:phosphotransferase [Streptomyces sp. RerS4]|uniref:phosphotransferase n=1 Tax=Streptomyces sp. RerS4 TaxID=2942449 RepID=UPI00201CA5EF|nr:phosphotransferase [Streptomyces sp. RerS4]UQX03567.1 aminoglycoside phosphotransferase family protein [Streptomyces sp. RerS4]
MTGVPGLTVGGALARVGAGDAEALEGRGLNASYRVAYGGRPYAVKVHCPERSSVGEFRRIERVDAALRALPWYPPVLDLGFAPGPRPRLVVVRPYAPGAASDDARQHIARVVDVLADLAARGRGVAVEEELIGDYASPWVADARAERSLAEPFLTGEWGALGCAVDEHLAELRAGAVRLTRPDGVLVHHGDLHGRNLVSDGSRALTVIDWDEAGFSRRPADAGKALWLSCRLGRGDFVLDGRAVGRFLERLHARLGLPYANAVDLARLGALWFLPRHGHVTLLGRRDADLGTWYLGWVLRFWTRFRRNLEVVAEAAAERAAGRSAG